MEIDVIILSYAKNADIIKMNNVCINSIIESSDKHAFNIILIETSDIDVVYPKQVTVIHPNSEFGYNKYLNIGLTYCKNEWIFISNNDTIYEKNFIDYMLEAYTQDNKLLSMSPIDDHWIYQNGFNRNTPIHYGYRLKYEIVCSSLLIHKKVLDVIGIFDENYTFWYQDDDYVKSLIKYNIKHALITKSKVHHLVSKSNHLFENWSKMVTSSENYFNNKWKKK